MSLFRLNKDSPIPLHTQLLNDLRRIIIAGQLSPHARVPSEPDLTVELGISRTTIRQAWRAAEEEGLLYRVAGKGTYVAEQAKPRPLRLVGFLIPNFRSTFDSQLLSGAERYLRDRSCRIIFAHTDRDIDQENQMLQELWQEGAAGFILWPALGRGEPRFLSQHNADYIPTVFIDRPIPNLDYPCVGAEHYHGAVLAIQHLIDLGHREIAFVSRPHLDLWPVAERLRGYEETMRAAGLPPRPPILVGDSAELGTRHAQQSYAEARGEEINQLESVFRQPGRPTAVFAMNDLMALQVLRAASNAGLTIPDDLSLVGFDDHEFVAHIDPPLTTIHQDPFEIGVVAAGCLYDLIQGVKPASTPILLPVRLVVRNSTGTPPTLP